MRYFYFLIVLLSFSYCGIKFHTRSPKSDIKTKEIIINNSAEYIDFSDMSVDIIDKELNIFKGEALIAIRLKGTLKKGNNVFPKIKRILFVNKLTNRSNREQILNSTYNWEIDIVPEIDLIEFKSKDDKYPNSQDFDLKEEYVFYAYTGLNSLTFRFGDRIKIIKINRGK